MMCSPRVADPVFGHRFERADEGWTSYIPRFLLFPDGMLLPACVASPGKKGPRAFRERDIVGVRRGERRAIVRHSGEA